MRRAGSAQECSVRSGSGCLAQLLAAIAQSSLPLRECCDLQREGEGVWQKEQPRDTNKAATLCVCTTNLRDSHQLLPESPTT